MIKTLPNRINHFYGKIDVAKTVFKISFISFILSIFFQMFFTNNLAIKSKELNDLSSRKEELHKEIARLEFEDSKVSSLAYIEEKAYEMGFIPLEKNVLAIKPAPSMSAAAVTSF